MIGERPTLTKVRSEAKYTKEVIGWLEDAIREKDWQKASEWANEISALWGSFSGDCEEWGGNN